MNKGLLKDFELVFFEQKKNSVLMIFLIDEISCMRTAGGNNFNVDDFRSYATPLEQ